MMLEGLWSGSGIGESQVLQCTQASVITEMTLKGRLQAWESRNPGLMTHLKIGMGALRRAISHPLRSVWKCPTARPLVLADWNSRRPVLCDCPSSSPIMVIPKYTLILQACAEPFPQGAITNRKTRTEGHHGEVSPVNFQLSSL